MRLRNHLYRDDKLCSHIISQMLVHTSNEDRSREFCQVGRASIWPIHKGWDSANTVRSRMVSQTTTESFPSADKEDDVSILGFVLGVQPVRNTGNGERMSLGWEAANCRQDDVGMLARKPVEASTEGQPDGVRREKLDCRGAVLLISRRSEAVVPQQAESPKYSVKRPDDHSGPYVLAEAECAMSTASMC